MKLFWKSVLVIALWLAGFFDAWSTLRVHSFVQLESNPIFFSIGIWGVLILKFVWIMIVSTAIFKHEYLAKTDFVKFFYIHIAVLMIFVQILVGISNVNYQQAISDIVDKPVSEVTHEDVKPFVADESSATRVYREFLITNFVFPFGLALVSFKLWEWCYFSGGYKNGFV